ncbi:DUF2490 domain-containing protein [Flavobacterium sp.]|uniref:DUF2490 domain-containing protein n=1 Tax=Flavobacterium sp. TaxID=239 RepID=UPI002611084A|nr:DUF2490 domain-containing protein [Flavobacterium sp.]MDG2431381.1 DUF2490 domain-containing protein [Flavobacterium sp.]
MKKISLFLTLFLLVLPAQAQNNTDKIGAWYMYFYNAKFKNSQFGIQGDVQYRNWNTLGDLEQLLVRSGLTYKPNNTDVTLTLGVAHITTGVIGESNQTTSETRIYQEALLPLKVGKRLYFNHRFRYEQRFVENQDFRSRFRYNLFLNIPLNKTTLSKNAVYIALYNEIFINGEKNIGDGRTVTVFDRNRFYTGVGYGLTDKLRLQMGFMNQSTENAGKDQIQLSLHHTF